MNLRRAALLALAGWYLLVLPRKSQGSMAVDVSAPLTEWHIFKSFDSVKECEALREKITQGEKGTEFYPAILTSACVVSDDPRLKGAVR
jgi:hypothetical protein